MYLIDSIEFLTIPRFKEKSFLQQKYVVEKLSTQQIADLCFSSRPTVSKYLKLHCIPSRRPEEHRQLNKGQLAFGERRWKGAVRKSRTEGKTIKTIVDLRDKGYSYRQIAAWLDAKGIRTKNNRASWKPTTIMKILERGGRRVTL